MGERRLYFTGTWGWMRLSVSDYAAFLADSKRSMTIDRLATFLKMEAPTRPPGKSGS